MRKAEGGAVSQIPEMPYEGATPPPMPAVMPTLKTMQSYGNKPPVDPSDIIRMQQAAEMARLLGNTPPAPQEPTPQSVFGTTRLPTPIPEMYGTSPGPMPTMPNEPMMPSSPKPAFGGFDESSMPNLPSRRFTEPVMPEYTPEMFARDRAQNAARAADQAATLQAQQEMAAQAQMDRGLGLDLGGRRNLAPSYGRNPYLPRS